MDEDPQGGQPESPAADEFVPPAIDGKAPDASALEIEPTASASAPEIDPTEPPPPLDIEPAPPPVPPGPPPFTVRALLKDTFARYAADFVRLFLVAAAIGAVNIALALIELGRAVSGRGSETAGSVVGVIVGIIGTSILMALVGGGRQISLLGAIAKGLRRSFRAFLVLFAMTLSIGFTVGVSLLVAQLLLRGLGVVFWIVAAALVLIGVWMAARLYLALPAVVVDGVGAADALSMSWRTTRRVGVWLRLLASVLLLGFLFGWASLGAVIVLLISDSGLALLAWGVLGTALVTPVAALLLFSAYRRLVPEHGQDWVSDATVAPFVPPRFGRGAKLLLTGALVAGLVGLISLPFAAQAVLRNRVAGPAALSSPDFVRPGIIAFGNRANLRTCEVHDQRSRFTAAEGFAWVGTLTSPTSPTDKVALRVSEGGVVLGTVDEQSGSYLCIGLESRDIGLPPGTFLIEVVVNGEVRASGTVTLT